MSVEIKRVLGGTKEDIESNKYNIWVGISLGNKSFTKELIKEYIEYALKFTREDVLIVIPDRLHAVNIEIRDRKSKLSQTSQNSQHLRRKNVIKNQKSYLLSHFPNGHI